MREWFARLFDWFRREKLDRELAEELRFHQHQLERSAMAGGASESEAEHDARRRLGGSMRVREAARERWSIPALETVIQETRYALRSLRRTPGFTATVVLTLALGIGANAMMFDVLDRLMFRPLALLRDPGSVHRVYLTTHDFGQPNTSSWMPYARYEDFRRWTSSFSQVAGFNERSMAIGLGDNARERRVGMVTASFFELFDAPPVQGRYFNRDEDAYPRGANVAVLSQSFWQTEFGGRDMLGEVVQVGSIPATVIGIAPKGLAGVHDASPPSVFIPIATMFAATGDAVTAQRASGYGMFWGNMLVRRKPGVSAEQASVDVNNAFQRSWTAERELDPRAQPLSADAPRPTAVVSSVRLSAGPERGMEARTALWVWGVAGVVLLIACANIVNLFLVRAVRRQRETAVRLALGVHRGRLVTQAAAEGLAVAVVGGIGGLLVSQWGGASVRALLMPTPFVPPSTAIEWRTIGVAVALAMIVGVVTGLAPVLSFGRMDVSAALRTGQRGGTRGSRLRLALIVAQSALSVVLLVGALLFVRSLSQVRNMRMGYDAERVLLVQRVLRGVQLDDDARLALRRQLLATAQAVPGVEYVSWIATTPLGTTGMSRISVPGVDSVSRLGQFTWQQTTSDYFKVMGTRIIRGRSFTEEDGRGAPRVLVVSDGMAKVLWPGKDPIGQCVKLGRDTMPCTTVIGVAEDMVQTSVTTADRFHYYAPMDQHPGYDGSGMAVRMRGDPAVEGERVRQALQRVMPGASYVTVRPMGELVDGARRPWRLGAALFAAFGLLALVVASVGLYGVISYIVTQRLPELGIRLALGARRQDIVWLVVAQATRVALAGVAIGTLLALVAARWIQPLLFRQSATDPPVYTMVAVVLVVVSIVASAMPALRASRSDPNMALRAD